MADYYILDPDGYLKGTYSGDGEPASCTVVPPPDNAIQPLRFVAGAWLVPPPVVAPLPHITQYAFLNRMNRLERIAVRTAAKSDVTAEDFFDMLNSASYVDMTLPELNAGMAYLVSINALSADRADAILNAPIQDSERP